MLGSFSLVGTRLSGASEGTDEGSLNNWPQNPGCLAGK